MKTPYEILEVPETATDGEIKKAYLGKVRAFPPERFPGRFQEIRKAFENIQTYRERLKYSLFQVEPPHPQTLLVPWLEGPCSRPSQEQLLRMLAWSLRQSGPP